MEKAEAIKILDSRPYTGEVREALEILIPELKESEDERIIKTLQEYVKNRNWMLNGPTQKDCLAWLEKQKETIPCNVDEFTLTLRNCLFADLGLTKEQADIFATTYGEELLNVAIGKIKSGLTKEDIADFKVKKQKDHFRDDTKMVEQKPAEWSDEDEDMLNSCISLIEEAKENRYAYKETDGDTSYDHEIDWLKSLRPSWKPSEEDIKMLEHIIGQYETGNKNSKVMGYLPRVEELSFLKNVLSKWKN